MAAFLHIQGIFILKRLSGGMTRTVAPARIFGAALLAAALAAGGAPGPAVAQSACQPVDPRMAAQSGQVAPLSRFLGSIRQATGGGTAIGSQLCQIGGRLVYRVQVIIGGRQVTIDIDASSGARMN
jgi:hypothetical protein